MRFNMNNYSKCPSCKTPYIDPRAKEIADSGELLEETLSKKVSATTQSVSKSTTSRTTQSSDALVEAQNRTTHAVRALAITFVAAPIIFLVVGGFMLYAVSTEELGLIVISLIIGIVAFGWILVSSLSELSKSYVR
jgi:F0F1-type ATP synthase assembly protein I